MAKTPIKTYINVTLTLRKNGEVMWKRRYRNLVTSAGLAAFAALLNAGSAKPTHIALGDSDAAVTIGQTALQGSQHGSRVAGTPANISAEFSLSGTFTNAGGDISVKECGIFSASAAGTMFARFLPSTFSMANGDTLDIEWILEFS